MYKQLTSVAVFAAMIFCLLSPFSVSAEEDDSYFKKNYDAICASYGLTGELSIDENFYYVYGRQDGGSGNPVSVLFVGGRWYRAIWQQSAAVPSYSFYTGTASFSSTTDRCGHNYATMFYYNPTSSQVKFLYGSTDNLIIFNQVSDIDGWNYSTASTYEDFSSSLGGSSDPTEPTSSGGFVLPDSWLNGGETLPSVEDPTFPASFSPDEAFGYIEDYTVELDEGTKSGIGFFWAVLTGVIGALGIWDYIFFALLMGLFAWVLRGVF